MTRAYVYDGEDIVEERAGGTTTRIVHGPGIDQPLAAVTGSTPTYYLADHLGSIAQQTNSSQQVTLTRTYDPFGNLTSGASASGYAFTGREWDAEIGLYYYRARYYDAGLGRFISADPWGFVDGPNVYAYVSNSPTYYRDPTGRQWQVPALAGAGAGGGTAVVTGGVVSNPVGWVVGGLIVVGAAAWWYFSSDEEGQKENPKTDPQVCELPGPSPSANEGAQDKRLTKWEIDLLERNGFDVHELKGPKSGGFDLFKNRDGEVLIKPKNGKGPGEPIGVNIKTLGGKKQ